MDPTPSDLRSIDTDGLCADPRHCHCGVSMQEKEPVTVDMCNFENCPIDNQRNLAQKFPYYQHSGRDLTIQAASKVASYPVWPSQGFRRPPQPNVTFRGIAQRTHIQLHDAINFQQTDSDDQQTFTVDNGMHLSATIQRLSPVHYHPGFFHTVGPHNMIFLLHHLQHLHDLAPRAEALDEYQYQIVDNANAKEHIPTPPWMSRHWGTRYCD